MEIILAVVVVFAVIFFGALISMGNERQRRAIDGLREQTVLWAMQDLRIKREKLTRDVKVDDPLGWINRIAAKGYGYDLNLQVTEFFDQPQALVCTSGDGGRVIFSPLSSVEIRALKQSRKSKLGQYTNGNPLLDLPRGVSAYEVSVLNGGMMFDLELPIAWRALTGQAEKQIERLWIYSAS